MGIGGVTEGVLAACATRAMGGGMLMALVAIPHVIVSHFAIGGGLLIVVTEALSVKREEIYGGLEALLGRYDAVLCLASTGPAPKGFETTGSAIFNGLWTYLGVPCVSLPRLEVRGQALHVPGSDHHEHAAPVSFGIFLAQTSRHIAVALLDQRDIQIAAVLSKLGEGGL